MGTKYKQLDLAEREKMAILKAEGKSYREIAKIMGRNHSTILREFKRHVRDTRYKLNCYLPIVADVEACWKKIAVMPKRNLKCPEIQNYVEEKIKQGWSPEQVSGRLSIDFPNLSISHTAIYKYIYRKAKHLLRYLPREHRYPLPKKHGHGKKIKILNRVPITERLEEVQARSAFGHWESDALISRASKMALHVLVERKSRYLHVTRIQRNNAHHTVNAICRRLLKYGALVRQSIAYDNGSENVGHEIINKQLGTQSFFCEPYHSWEKGTVENTNGLIRRFIPKKTDMAMLSLNRIKRIEKTLNNRPRKCLGYLTPKEMFTQLSGALVS